MPEAEVVSGDLSPTADVGTKRRQTITPQGRLRVDAVLSAGGEAASDGSTTITLGGTAQNLFAGATPSNGFAIYNPDPSEALWVSDSTTAAANGTGSIYIPPLGGYETPPHYQPYHAVSIVGATTGHKITARKW